jgi:hypothetical protein
MTARWSGVVLGGRKRLDPRTIHEVEELVGFPTVLRRMVSEEGVQRVLVTRNVGCRNGVRGILATGSRQAVRPSENSTSSDGRGR